MGAKITRSGKMRNMSGEVPESILLGYHDRQVKKYRNDYKRENW
jgi:hypothetical protein